MLKAIRRTFLPLNRWYDDLDTEHGDIRFLLFLGFVAVPLSVGQILFTTHPLIGIPLIILGASIGIIRVTAFL